MRRIGFTSDGREDEDFYSDNMGKSVNLYNGGNVVCGDICDYDGRRGIVKLTNYIERVPCGEDGKSQLMESQKVMEIDVSIIHRRELGSKIDRKARIFNGNKDIEVEELERANKIAQLEKSLEITKSTNQEPSQQQSLRL